ncbi:hypothetical protein NDU88_005211 [Pleurodeles waltl]|uniref:Uncharacterized protein n=1 Tax=Pleurodeles waltl TaxID=8319 RepID=A0AAV7MZT9_PLEWA|nr:hypothetical protein NDU88_005211 [Pleurodeles waltl]
MAAGRAAERLSKRTGPREWRGGHMCRLTGIQEDTSGAAGAVLWRRAVLELQRTRLAVARFPLRGRSSGSNKRSGRASTSSLLHQELRVGEEVHGSFVPIMKKGSQGVHAVEEAAGLVKVESDDYTRCMGPEKGAQYSVSKTMEEVATEVSVEIAVGDKSGGKKISAQLLQWI